MYHNEKSAIGGAVMAPPTTNYNHAACDAAVAASPVAVCLGRLTNVQGETHELLEMLERRLGSILRPPYPQPDTKPAEGSTESALCAEITSRADSGSYINEKLRMIFDRLTV